MPFSRNNLKLKLCFTTQLLACTRRPVKDKGALMQTLLSLRSFRDLRAVLLELRPSRRPTPSMHECIDMEGRTATLPNHPKPTCAVGLRRVLSHGSVDHGPALGRDHPWPLSKRLPQYRASLRPDLQQIRRAALCVPLRCFALTLPRFIARQVGQRPDRWSAVPGAAVARFRF